MILLPVILPAVAALAMSALGLALALMNGTVLVG